LTNRLGRNIPLKVPPALIKAGLPSSSVAAFIGAVGLNPSGNFSDIAGMTPEIAKVGLRAYQEASLSSYNTVWFSTIAITAISILFTIWAPNVNHLLTSDVNAPIHERNSDRVVGAKESLNSVEQV
jgi:hypothetical protein